MLRYVCGGAGPASRAVVACTAATAVVAPRVAAAAGARGATQRRAARAHVASDAAAPRVAHIGGVRPDGASRRFFRRAAVRGHNDESGGRYWTVELDGRVIVTPKEQVLRLPTQALALAVAAEWQRQLKRVRPHTMPVMTLATSVVDEVPGRRATMVGNLCAFIDSDTVCVRSDDEALRAKQAELLDPIAAWFRTTLKCPLDVANASAQLTGFEQPEQTHVTLQWYLFGLDDYELCAVESLAHTLKSAVLALAVHGGRVDAEGAFRASRIEEHSNFERWGRADGPSGSDIDEADLLMRISSCALLLRLYRYDDGGQGA